MMNYKIIQCSKLFIIAGDLFPKRGGVADYTLNISKELAQYYKIYILTSRYSDKNDKAYLHGKGEKNNTLAYDYNEEKLFKVFPDITKWSLKNIPKILSLIKIIKPDAILVQYVPYMYNYYGLPFWLIILFIILRILNYKIILRIHEIAINWAFNPVLVLISISQRFIANFLCLLSDVCLVNMLYFAKMLKICKGKIRIVPIGSSIIISEERKQKIEKEIIKLKVRINENNKNVVLSSFGIDASYRRYDVVLEVLRRNDNLKFLYIGEGNNLLKLARDMNLESKTIITGYLAPEDVYTYLRCSDLFIMLHADIRGGVGTKSGALMAAFYLGLPIIACKGKITDQYYFKHLENIYLINECTPEKLSNAIYEILNDENLMIRLCKGAKRTYDAFFSWTKIAELYKKEIDIIIKKNHKPLIR